MKLPFGMLLPHEVSLHERETRQRQADPRDENGSPDAPV